MPRLTGKKVEGLEAVKLDVESANGWLEKAVKEFDPKGENQAHLKKNIEDIVTVLKLIVDTLEMERMSEKVKKRMEVNED